LLELLLTSEAGIGKSRLTTPRYFCSPQHVRTAFHCSWRKRRRPCSSKKVRRRLSVWLQRLRFRHWQCLHVCRSRSWRGSIVPARSVLPLG
jgi:hypothetical protein